MHRYGYAEPGDWTPPVPVLADPLRLDDVREVMRMLTKRIPHG